MGAVTNMRPDLFNVVLSRGAFRRRDEHHARCFAAADGSGVRGVGQSQHEPRSITCSSYSPYDNLSASRLSRDAGATSFDDSQVMYWEPAKYVAKLRTLKTDQYPLVFYTNMHGGHGGSSGRYDRIHEVAFNWAFLLTQLDVPEPDAATKP